MAERIKPEPLGFEDEGIINGGMTYWCRPKEVPGVIIFVWAPIDSRKCLIIELHNEHSDDPRSALQLNPLGGLGGPFKRHVYSHLEALTTVYEFIRRYKERLP